MEAERGQAIGPYDSIGAGYPISRQADPRIVDAIVRLQALEPGTVLADIGAGTGNYARALAARGFRVVAIEPSVVMRDQAASHPLVEFRAGTAEELPLPDRSVDGVINILSLHHYADPARAFSEMARVVGDGPILVFTFDPRSRVRPWLANYFPTLWDEAYQLFPPLATLTRQIEAITRREVAEETFLLPHDLRDLFFAAGWRRPEIYLDVATRANMSACALADPEVVRAGVTRLAADLGTGEWRRRYGTVMEKASLDLGYRFLIARKPKGDTAP